MQHGQCCAIRCQVPDFGSPPALECSNSSHREPSRCHLSVGNPRVPAIHPAAGSNAAKDPWPIRTRPCAVSPHGVPARRVFPLSDDTTAATGIKHLNGRGSFVEGRFRASTEHAGSSKMFAASLYRVGLLRMRDITFDFVHQVLPAISKPASRLSPHDSGIDDRW